jgi:hypothetical protein
MLVGLEKKRKFATALGKTKAKRIYKFIELLRMTARKSCFMQL